MNRIDLLNRRYAASASLAEEGVEIVAVGDPAGARFNIATRQLMSLAKEAGGTFLDDLLAAAKLLRWTRITQPQPTANNPRLQNLALEVTKRAKYLRDAIDDQALLDELASAASEVAATDSEVAAILLQSIEEVGADACVVVAASGPAADGLKTWLRHMGVLVLTSGELGRDQPQREQAYVVGPPRFYPSSLVTAPVTDQMSFLLPAWFSDRSIPQSAIAPYAEGTIRLKARVHVEGDTSEPVVDLPDDSVGKDEYLPQPRWGSRREHDREPSSEEVEARKLLLSGNLAMWLDDGDRIRSLDPDQPCGERVTYTNVAAVREGTYLLVRQGETERHSLYQASLNRLTNGNEIARTQTAWKHLLAKRIQKAGLARMVEQLRTVGIHSADRARAWTDPNLIRPAKDQDFEKLLNWLGIPTQPTLDHANRLRKTLYKVSAEIGKELESAISVADLSELKANGHLSIDFQAMGFRGILATRVLAVSPFTEVVSRSETRLPFEDRSGQWLE